MKKMILSVLMLSIGVFAPLFGSVEEARKLNKQIKNDLASLPGIDSNIKALTRKKNSLDSDIQHFKSEKKKYESEFDEDKEEVMDELARPSREGQAAIAKLNREIELKEQEAESQEEFQKERIKSANKELASLGKNLKADNNKADKLKKAHESAAKNLDDYLSEYMKKYKIYSRELINEKTAVSLQKQQLKLQVEVHTLEQDIKDLRPGFFGSFKPLDPQLTEAQEKLKSKKEELETLQSQIKDFAIYEEKKNNLENIEKTQAELRDRIVDADKKITARENEIKKANELLEEARTKNKRELANLKQELEKTEDALHKHRTTIDADKQKEELVSKKLAEISKELETQTNALKEVEDKLEAAYTARYSLADNLIDSIADATQHFLHSKGLPYVQTLAHLGQWLEEQAHGKQNTGWFSRADRVHLDRSEVEKLKTEIDAYIGGHPKFAKDEELKKLSLVLGEVVKSKLDNNFINRGSWKPKAKEGDIKEIVKKPEEQTHQVVVSEDEDED